MKTLAHANTWMDMKDIILHTYARPQILRYLTITLDEAVRAVESTESEGRRMAESSPGKRYCLMYMV